MRFSDASSRECTLQYFCHSRWILAVAGRTWEGRQAGILLLLLFNQNVSERSQTRLSADFLSIGRMWDTNGVSLDDRPFVVGGRCCHLAAKTSSVVSAEGDQHTHSRETKWMLLLPPSRLSAGLSPTSIKEKTTLFLSCMIKQLAKKGRHREACFWIPSHLDTILSAEGEGYKRDRLGG